MQEPSEEAGGEGSCLLTEQIAVEIGSNALLDVALLFENGGECRNQIVRTLTLSRVAMPGLPPPPSLFVCSNIPGTEFMGLCCDDNRMINTESKFSVIYDTTCERECKYRISLRLNNFNYIDVGLYEAVVSMDEGRIGARRVIKKYFNLTATAPGMHANSNVFHSTPFAHKLIIGLGSSLGMPDFIFPIPCFENF